MLSIFNVESNLHWILFSLHKEIIEHSHLLLFPGVRTPVVIRHTEATFESDVSKQQSNIRINLHGTLLLLSL